MENKIIHNSDVIKTLLTSNKKDDKGKEIDEYITNLISKTNNIDYLNNKSIKDDFIKLLSLYIDLLNPSKYNYYNKILKKFIRQDMMFKFLIFNNLIKIWKEDEYFGTVIYETIKKTIIDEKDTINDNHSLKSDFSNISNISNFISEKDNTIYELRKELEELKIENEKFKNQK